MSRTNYQTERIQKSAQFEEDFNKRIAVFRAGLYREVITYLSSRFKEDANGRVRLTVGNIRATNSIPSLIQSFVKRRGTNLIRWVIRRLSDLFKINTNYFRSFMEYPKSRDEKAIRLLLMRLGYDNQNNKVIKDGFLSNVFQISSVATSIARDIQQALTVNLTLSAFKKLFRSRFLAAKYVEKWFNRFTRDLFHQFDSSSQKVLADELGLEYFVYAGTEIKTTRCFCERRINRIYTKGFAGRWNNISWRGKIPNGDFFIDRGGYNCRHHLSYITERRAERVSNQRGFKINSFNETDCNDERKI